MNYVLLALLPNAADIRPQAVMSLTSSSGSLSYLASGNLEGSILSRLGSFEITFSTGAVVGGGKDHPEAVYARGK